METHVDDKKKAICRICLKYDIENLNEGMSIYETHKDMFIYEKILYIASIEIPQNNNLPHRICSMCLQALDIAYNFKQKCEQSDAFFRSESYTIAEVPIKKEYLDTEKSYFDDVDRNSPCFYQEDEHNSSEKLKNDEKPSTFPYPKSKAVNLKLECHDCGEIFKSKCKLRVHWKKVHLSEQLICPYCKQQFKSIKAFTNHSTRRTQTCIDASKVRVEGVGKSRIFYCNICDVSSKRIQILARHIVTHTGEKPFVCDICNKGFSQQSSLQGHKEGVHKQYIKEVTCELCGKHLKGRNRWTIHMQRHRNEKFPCSMCNKVYSSKTILKLHMKRHSDVKSFACEICAKTFYLSSDLRNHKMRAHLKKQMYMCNECEYKTPYHTLMSRHRGKHTGNNISCTICGAFVDNKQQLVLHQKRHFERNFKCPYCDKTFYSKKSVGCHVRVKHNSFADKVEEKALAR